MSRRALRLPRVPDRWFDRALAGVAFVALVAENATVRQPLNVLALAAMTVPLLWRRRAPFAYTVAVLASATALVASLSADGTNLAPLYVLTVPPYSVAAYRQPRPALLGLALCLAWAIAVTAAKTPGVGNYAGTAVSIGVAWGLGRWMRARRMMSAELERKARRIEAERESRARLAVADERTRIARELHALVAASVSAMVVQAEAAQRLLDADLVRAEQAMTAVEQTGRDALEQMRRILGVLRRTGEAPQLAPQPGVGQLHALVERARGERRQVELSVEGEPGPLPASVDLGLYRIVEEALAGAGADPSRLVGVRLRFGARDVELEISAAGASGSPAWPTLAMRERVAICGGMLRSEPCANAGRRLVARLPRAFEEAFA